MENIEEYNVDVIANPSHISKFPINTQMVRKAPKSYREKDEDDIPKTKARQKYLHIQGLIDITTMEVARKMENKTPEQIRDLFKLENDLETNNDDNKDDENMETND